MCAFYMPVMWVKQSAIVHCSFDECTFMSLCRESKTSNASCRPLIRTISASWRSRRSLTSWLVRQRTRRTQRSRLWRRSASWQETRSVRSSRIRHPHTQTQSRLKTIIYTIDTDVALTFILVKLQLVVFSECYAVNTALMRSLFRLSVCPSIRLSVTPLSCT